MVTPEAATEWARKNGLSLRYAADLPKLHAAGAPFTQLALDQETADYIGSAEGARHGLFMTWAHRMMRGFLSDFDINGYLGTYPMHVLSTEQWRAVLPITGGRLLDVGAGRGDATAKLAALFDETVVTETSHAMAQRLRKQGYQCIEGDIAAYDGQAAHEGAVSHGVHQDIEGSFDAVSLLNVLDRCDSPLSLLGVARRALKVGGLLVVALVLPYGPFVYDAGATRRPRERLPIQSHDFEVAATEFITTAILPLGFTVVTLSRAPYLSGGDAHQPLYELDDLIVVCRATGGVPLVGGA